MFATNNITKNTRCLVLISGLLCLSQSYGQDSEDTENAPGSDENRRIERLGEGNTQEWEMDLAMPQSSSSSRGKTQSLALPDEAQNQQLNRLISSLAKNPNNQKAISELNALLRDVLGQANQLIDTGKIAQAGQMLDIIQSVDPGFGGLLAARQRLESTNEITQLLIAGNAALESGRVLEPEDSSAKYYFDRALQESPNNTAAKQGLSRVQKKLLELALESSSELDFETAQIYLSDAAGVQQDQQPVENTRKEVSDFKQKHATELQERALAAMASGNFGIADFSIIDLIALGDNATLVTDLREKLKKARYYGGFVPGQVFRDELSKSGGSAPEVVVIAQGSFLMGSRSHPDNDHEKPLHRVTLSQGFGMGVKEVTVAEFQLFVEKTQYQTAAETKGTSFIYDESAGRLSRRSGTNWRHGYNGKKAKPEMPVLHVSFHDVHAYLQWLSKETGMRYRLPSEAEYEYVAKAGGKSTYWWGEGSPSELVENLTGERDNSPGKRQWTTFFKKYSDGHWGPGPAGAINDGKLLHPMGVHDIAGNVSEWTEDCWHQNYIQAPANGSAWVNRGCSERVVRGGYWASAPEKSRAAFRFAVKAESYGPVIGFRIARDL